MMAGNNKKRPAIGNGEPNNQIQNNDNKSTGFNQQRQYEAEDEYAGEIAFATKGNDSFIDSDFRLKISIFTGVHGKEPESKSLTIQDTSDLFTPPSPPSTTKEERKDRQVFSLTIYKQGTTRKKESVEAMTGVVFDFDNKEGFVSIETILTRLEHKGIIHFWYTTWSHKTERPRWRLIIPFAAPLLVADWNTVYEKMVHMIGSQPGIDHSACKDVAHIWFPPYKNIDHPFDSGSGGTLLLHPSDIELFFTPEERTDYRRQQEEKNLSVQRKKSFVSLSESSELALERIKELLNHIDPGCPYDQWIKVGMALHSYFEGTNKGFNLWVEWSREASEKFPGEPNLSEHWKSFTTAKENLVTIGTLIHYAKEGGYKDSERTTDFFKKHLQKGQQSNHALLKLTTASEVDLARHFLNVVLKQKYGEIIYDEGEFWRYGGMHWEVISYQKLSQLLHDYDGKQWENKKGKPQILKMGNNTVKNILVILRTEGTTMMGGESENGGFFNNRNFSKPTGINCLSGFIQIDTKGNYKLLPHDKSHRLQFTVPFEFKPDLLEYFTNLTSSSRKKDSLLARLLLGCFQGDEDIQEKIRFIMQLAGVVASGYAFRLKTPLAILFYGASAENGKSQMLDMLESLLSPTDICSVDPEFFGNETRRHNLKNKKLNVVADLSGKALESNLTKLIITGDIIDAKELYKMPINFRCKAQHVWATNKFPSFMEGMDKGIQRRIGVVSFNRVIPPEERVIDIGKRIAKEEGELLLAFSVCGIMDVIGDNNELSFPPSSLGMMQQWQAEADPVIGFIQECIEYDKDSFVSSTNIYTRFLTWAKQSGWNGKKLPASTLFIERLKQNLPSSVSHTRTNKARGFKGMKLSSS